MTSYDELRVLSLNCWGLKFVSVKRQERLRAIGDWLASTASRRPSITRRTTTTSSTSSTAQDSVLDAATPLYDVVALQELWVEDDYNYIRTRLEESDIPHSRFFHSGVIGSGLAIFSRYPILDSFVHAYSLSGQPLHAIEGDFYAAKAVSGALVDVPVIGPTWILNTHMFAPGGEAETASGAHRIAQFWELGRIVRERGAYQHLVLLGDFNTQPQATAMRFLRSFAQLQDAWIDTHDPPPSLDSQEHFDLSPADCIEVHGVTCDSPVNSFSAAKLKKRSPRDETLRRHGKRLDFVLYRRQPRLATASSSPTASLSCRDCFVTLLDLIPGLGMSYSDHFGLAATISFDSGHAAAAASPANQYQAELERMLSNLSISLAQSQARSQKLLQGFVLCVGLLLAFSAAASAQPLRALSWVFVLLGGASAALAATLLYAGFIGGRWEQGNLRNVIDEMQRHLASL